MFLSRHDAVSWCVWILDRLHKTLISLKVLTGLVAASDTLTAKYDGMIRPLVFLREDIFSVLPLNDANKLREDCGALLKWERVDLFKLLLRRLSYYANQKGINSVTELDTLFDKKEMRQRTKPSNYLLKRSMMRPRDMICLMNRTIEAMKDSVNDPFEETPVEYDNLTVEAIYTAEPGYSEWLKQELLDEWSVQHPRIKQLFDAIQNHASTQFTRGELEEQLKNLSIEVTQSELLKDLRFFIF
ncbi:P-loop ATPase, Sll1717 family [Acaryochloris sp. 'Moss Beach']|uniref:P-loop ATPase, Sll1717 family n=1 Tax=Acaryochloris sp. 'Moss Beach' TaxID=2740837 RepID=UPI001F270D35|nr:hypothetical protein [Acaryochloris sp. 'Moss Beach']